MTTPEKDPKTGRFLTGNSGGGRQRGSRNKLASEFFDDLYAAWLEHGADALRRMALNNPKDFVKVAAMVVPKEVDLTIEVEARLFAEIEDFKQAWQIARQHIGAEPILLEAHDIETK